MSGDSKISDALSGFSAFTVKIIPPLVVASILSVSAGAWATYRNVQELTDKMREHDSKITHIQNRLELIEVGVVKRTELLELLKRVEQQLEIALLRSGVPVAPKALASQ